MTPSIPYIKQKFEEYNKLCFEGSLKPITFQLSNARRFLGQISYMRKRNLDGTWYYYQFVFKISTKFDLPEDTIEDTILHEMIHYYILSNQIQDTSTHGVLFKRIMNHLNAKYNRHITISHKATKDEHDKDCEVRQHLVCVTTFKDGRKGITVAAKSRIFALWDAMPKFPDVKETKWYTTLDSYFNRFPRALTPKIYKATNDDIEAHLADALELERKGRYIQVKR